MHISKFGLLSLLVLFLSASVQAEFVMRGEYLVRYPSPSAYSLGTVAGASSEYKLVQFTEDFQASTLTASASIKDQMIAYTKADDRCDELLAKGAISCTPNYVIKIEVEAPSFNALATQRNIWSVNSSPGSGASSSGINNGNGIVVAIVDTGIDIGHPALSGKLWENPNEIAGNGIDDDGNGVIDDVNGFNSLNIQAAGNPLDDNGHGTHVAGTVVGSDSGFTYGPGVAVGAKVMATKFLDKYGYGTLAGAMDCLRYIINAKKAGVNIAVSNNSWGGRSGDRPILDMIQEMNELGIIFVAAAGNSANNNDQTPEYPASFSLDNIVSVAATDSDGNLASFSNYGASSVDIAAPGVGIISSLPGNRYGMFSGTSMASPHVAGALARIMAEHKLVADENGIKEAINLLRTSYSDSVFSLNSLVRGSRLLNLTPSGSNPCLTGGECGANVEKISFLDPRRNGRKVRNLEAGNMAVLQIEGDGNGEVVVNIRGGLGKCEPLTIQLREGNANLLVNIPNEGAFERAIKLSLEGNDKIRESARISGGLAKNQRLSENQKRRFHLGFCRRFQSGREITDAQLNRISSIKRKSR